MAPYSDDSVNRQNYKTERRPAHTALMTHETDDAGEISADVAERTGWKTDPVSDINDIRRNIQSSYNNITIEH